VQKAEARPVSRRHDRHEHEADRAADVVARGGSVASWSFSAVPAAAPVQRQDDGKPKSDDEKKKQAVTKAGEAFLETKPGKELKEKVLADPLVKTVKDAVTSPAGIAATAVAAGGGVAALAATHKPLPFQPPSIPLDRITPGLSAQVKYEGPVDKPTFVGLSLTFKEKAPKGKGPSKSDEIAADTARLRAQAEMFKPQAQKQAEKRDEDAFVQAWIRSQRLPSVVVPLTQDKPPTPDAPTKEEEKKPEDESKKKEEEEKAPVQRAPASAAAASPEHADVDDALATPGRALDSRTQRTMEARFGYDFSGVRIHDDARAAETASQIDAAAFTVGQEIVFGAGRYDPSGPTGLRLLAHELAHTLQQGEARPAGSGRRPLGRPDDRWEREAVDASRTVLAGGPPAPPRTTPAPPAVQRQQEVPIDLEAATPEEAKRLKEQGVDLPKASAAAADPRSHSDFVERRMNSVGFGIYLGGFFVYCDDMSLPLFVSDAYTDLTITNATSVGPSIYPDRDSALKTLPFGPYAPGQAVPYAYYRVPGSTVIVPTVFSPATTPRTIETLLEARRELARQVQHELTVLALGMVGGMVLKFALGRLARIFRGSGPKAPPPAGSLEAAKLEADRLVKGAVERGEEVVVNVGGAGAAHEPPGAINLNNQAVARKGIPNLVQADGAEIGTIFKPGTVDRFEGHNMAPGAVDWSRGASGAYRALKPGGTFTYYYRGANPDAALLGKALRAAGFKNVEVIADVLVKAVK
jgi:hypothetical protein